MTQNQMKEGRDDVYVLKPSSGTSKLYTSQAVAHARVLCTLLVRTACRILKFYKAYHWHHKGIIKIKEFSYLLKLEFIAASNRNKL